MKCKFTISYLKDNKSYFFLKNNISQKRLALNKPFSDLLNHIIHINSLSGCLSAPPMAVVFIGHGKTILSMETGEFMDGKLFLRSASRKKAVFLDGKTSTKKETPRKDVSVAIW